MVAPGKFVLHANALPPLTAGPYTLHATQTITAPGSAVDPLDAHIEVTAPRFLLPADQVLSTFPPNQAQGAFSSRLPQIVLKRRTLPWEREVDGRLAPQPPAIPREVPWMALVLLADAEAEFKSNRPIVECVTPGTVLEGRNDVPNGNAITVSQSVVDHVFPAKDELPLLVHVRQVDMYDTELAIGDDDGWLAVVMSSRLPQPGVRYRACLISIEGQYDALPTSHDVEDEFGSIYVYPDAVRALASMEVAASTAPDSGGAAAASMSMGGSPTARSSRSAMTVDAWSAAHGVPAAAASSLVPPARTYRLFGDMHAVGMDVIAPLEAQYTFPVLAQWSFACSGPEDFRSLMLGLDVGLLGSLPAEPQAPGPGDKPLPLPTRPLPEVLDTGHIGLAYRTRAGEETNAWYRGPLLPRPASRVEPDAGGLLPVVHTSDQARMIGADGRENLALAAAFEIGRLLALADPSIVAALLQWRRDGFDESRRTALVGKDAFLGALLQGVGIARLAPAAGIGLLAGLGAGRAARLGPVRPFVDPGSPVEGIDDEDPVSLVARGFAVSPDAIRALAEPGVARSGLALPQVGQVTEFGQVVETASTELAGLRGATDATAASLAVQALRRAGGTGGGVVGTGGPIIGTGSPVVGTGMREVGVERSALGVTPSADPLDHMLESLVAGAVDVAREEDR